MNATNKAWMVAASVGVVEALKDQAGMSSSVIPEQIMKQRNEMKQSEESLRKVMYLSCWGPN
ncbi:hypothetical protein MKW94_004672 [Papaver nudicaule]|uniref:Uncharacterized protein n=1 Tax=Papaver nudicaule TaxID=74823 RepID=A0AA41VS32_PAPNU|nr:hypothetical protein [Papaver nudicaule]